MNSKNKPLGVQLGLAAFLLYLIKPNWLDNSLLSLLLVVITLIFTTKSVLAVLIKTIKPSLYRIANDSVVMNTLGAVLLIIVSIKLQDVFSVYAGIVLGMALFVFALVFQRKKVTV